MPERTGAIGRSVAWAGWGSARLAAARVGVAACVAVMAFGGAEKLDDAVGFFDFRADENATASYAVRTYPDILWIAGSPAVMEDARLWMPEDAEYRVVEGRKLSLAESSGYGRHFLRTLLLPRTLTESESAPWVFCYACTQATLGHDYEVLSSQGDLLFARRRS
jgi:hypothetical protein